MHAISNNTLHAGKFKASKYYNFNWIVRQNYSFDNLIIIERYIEQFESLNPYINFKDDLRLNLNSILLF